MTDTEIIKACAELDGWQSPDSYEVQQWTNDRMIEANCWWKNPDGKFQPINYEYTLPPYLTSRDAIVSLIEKLPEYILEKCFVELSRIHSIEMLQDGETLMHMNLTRVKLISMICSTARQLCIALLKATNKWKD